MRSVLSLFAPWSPSPPRRGHTQSPQGSPACCLCRARGCVAAWPPRLPFPRRPSSQARNRLRAPGWSALSSLWARVSGLLQDPVLLRSPACTRVPWAPACTLTRHQVASGLEGSWPRGKPWSEGGAIEAHVRSLTSLTLPRCPALQPADLHLPSVATRMCWWPSAQLPRLGEGPCPQLRLPAGAAPGKQGWQGPGSSAVPSPETPRRV